jgi:hypothetical protein
MVEGQVRGVQRFILHDLSKLQRTPSPYLSPLVRGGRGRERRALFCTVLYRHHPSWPANPPALASEACKCTIAANKLEV